MDKFKTVFSGVQRTTIIGVGQLLFALRMIMVNPDVWKNDEHFMIFVTLVMSGLNGIFGADQMKNGGISPGKTDG